MKKLTELLRKGALLLLMGAMPSYAVAAGDSSSAKLSDDTIDSILVSNVHPINFKVNGTAVSAKDKAWIDTVFCKQMQQAGENDYIYCRASASPDGPVAYNTKMAARRMKSVLKALKQSGCKTDNIIIEEVPEDYNLLALLMKSANDQDADTVASIVNMKASSRLTKRALRAIKGGKLWRRLLREYYPKLRTVNIAIVDGALVETGTGMVMIGNEEPETLDTDNDIQEELPKFAETETETEVTYNSELTETETETTTQTEQELAEETQVYYGDIDEGPSDSIEPVEEQAASDFATESATIAAQEDEVKESDKVNQVEEAIEAETPSKSDALYDEWSEEAADEIAIKVKESKDTDIDLPLKGSKVKQGKDNSKTDKKVGVSGNWYEQYAVPAAKEIKNKVKRGGAFDAGRPAPANDNIEEDYDDSDEEELMEGDTIVAMSDSATYYDKAHKNAVEAFQNAVGYRSNRAEVVNAKLKKSTVSLVNNKAFNIAVPLLVVIILVLLLVMYLLRREVSKAHESKTKDRSEVHAANLKAVNAINRLDESRGEMEQMKDEMERMKAANEVTSAALQSAQNELTSVTEELARVNGLLSAANANLQGQGAQRDINMNLFYELATAHVNSLNAFQTEVQRKVEDNQIAELKKMVGPSRKSEQIARESFAGFDKAFLAMKKGFVNKVNALLRPEERFEGISEGGLNLDLRILALMSIGVKDATKISALLNCGQQTVYNHRSALKLRAISKDTFDKDIESI